MNILGIIPARGGKKGMSRRDLKLIHGKPLVAYTFEQALKSRRLSRIIVSTHDQEVIDLAKEYGIDVPFRRPKELSSDKTTVNSVLLHAVRYLEEKEDYLTDVVVTLQPISPLRPVEVIDEAVDLLLKTQCDSVITVTEDKSHYWKIKNGRIFPLFKERKKRIMEIEPQYRENGAVYVCKREILTEESRLGDDIRYVIMNEYSSFRVRNIHDIWLLERMLSSPKILFRVDGGKDIGMGHVFRTLTIADKLKEISQVEIGFLMNAAHREGINWIMDNGYPVLVSPKEEGSENSINLIKGFNPDIIITDLPKVNPNYMDKLSKTKAVLINLSDSIIDLNKTEDYADIIINCLYEKSETRAKYYHGPDYVSLRDRFKPAKKRVRKKGEKILVTFGGSDPQGYTLKTMRALEKLGDSIKVTVLLGVAFSYLEEVRKFTAKTNGRFTVKSNVDVIDYMKDCDFAICSGGGTVYELAITGTPAIVLSQNLRELDRMEKFSKYGTIINLGLGTQVLEDDLLKAANSISNNHKLRSQMSKLGQQLVDGKGVDRTVDLILNSVRG